MGSYANSLQCEFLVKFIISTLFLIFYYLFISIIIILVPFLVVTQLAMHYAYIEISSYIYIKSWVVIIGLLSRNKTTVPFLVLEVFHKLRFFDGHWL